MSSRKIEFEKLLNTRDLGGMSAAGGRKILPGKLVRSGQLGFASAGDLEKLSGLIEVSVDFRSDRECEERPEPPIPGVRYCHIPILDTRVKGVTRDEDSYEEVRKNMLNEAELSRKYMCRVYEDFATNEYCISRYEEFIRMLFEKRERAVLWHCTAGKDRAGFGTVIVQELLGVSREEIREDYLLTNVYLEPEVQGIIRAIREKTGYASEESEKGLRYMFCAWEEYLNAVYRRINEVYGSFDGYIEKALHISSKEREYLQSIYLEAGNQ